MVIYEVNLSVDADAAENYLIWLREHVAEMLTIDGFESAEVFAEDAAQDDGRRHFSVHYRMRDRDALDDYFRSHAERMRGAAMERFAGKFSACRRILLPAGSGY